MNLSETQKEIETVVKELMEMERKKEEDIKIIRDNYFTESAPLFTKKSEFIVKYTQDILNYIKYKQLLDSIAMLSTYKRLPDSIQLIDSIILVRYSYLIGFLADIKEIRISIEDFFNYLSRE